MLGLLPKSDSRLALLHLLWQHADSDRAVTVCHEYQHQQPILDTCGHHRLADREKCSQVAATYDDPQSLSVPAHVSVGSALIFTSMSDSV